MAIQTIEASYLKWIHDNTVFTSVLNNSVELSSPFTDSLDENIKIYIEITEGDFKITDSGYTIWNLESTGMSFRKGSHREALLQTLIRRMNVHLNTESKELYIMSDEKKLGSAIHSLTQSILSVSDLLWYGKKTVKSLFFEEVSTFFKEHREEYDPFPSLEIQGKSKLSHHFDYLMTVKNREKKLVRLINHLDQAQLERTLLSWTDTSKQRETSYGESLGMVALINDKEKNIPDSYVQAFEEYKIEPIGFYDKAAVKESLSLTG